MVPTGTLPSRDKRFEERRGGGGGGDVLPVADGIAGGDMGMMPEVVPSERYAAAALLLEGYRETGLSSLAATASG